jgi:hypothetical protein
MVCGLYGRVQDLTRRVVARGTRLRWATGLTQLRRGRKRRGGGRVAQTALALLRVLVVQGTLVRVESSCAVLDDWVALANGRAPYPPWDLTLSVTAGCFHDQDPGVVDR